MVLGIGKIHMYPRPPIPSLNHQKSLLKSNFLSPTPARGGYGDFGLFDSGLVDGAIEIFELCAFQICFGHQTNINVIKSYDG